MNYAVRISQMKEQLEEAIEEIGGENAFWQLGLADFGDFFDRGERHKGTYERRWIAGRKSGRGFSNHWDLVKSVSNVSAEDCKPVQLADLISWAHQRRLMFDRYPDNPKFWDGHQIWELFEKVFP
jgi:hypothetical protein